MSAKYSIVEGSTSDKGKCYLFRIHDVEDPLCENSRKPIFKGIPHLYLGSGFLTMYDARDAITFCNFLNSTSNTETK